MSHTRSGIRYSILMDNDNLGKNKNDKVGDDKGYGNTVVFPITKFEGDPLQLIEFLEEYNLFAASYGWSDALKCSRFPLHVKGTARQIVLNLTKEEREDWVKLGVALTKAILTTTPARTHRANFRVRVQKPHETVTKFAYDLKNLAMAALTNMDANARNELLFEQFMNGLRRELRTQVALADVQTFEAALQKAQLIESLGGFNDEVHAITEVKSSRPPNKDTNINNNSYQQNPSNELQYQL